LFVFAHVKAIDGASYGVVFCCHVGANKLYDRHVAQHTSVCAQMFVFSGKILMLR